MLDTQKQLKSIVKWKHINRNKEHNKAFSHYLSSFMYVAFIILNDQIIPRNFPELNEHLQLNMEIRVGKWFLFEDYTKIKLYGAEVQPYHLRVFFFQ